MKYENGFVSITMEEACLVAGGKSPAVAEFFRQLGYAAGIVSRYLYDLFHREEQSGNYFMQ